VSNRDACGAAGKQLTKAAVRLADLLNAIAWP
jgi:hypothetical protein